MMDDDFVLPPDIEAEIAADCRRYDRQQRWAALRMLWGRPIKNNPRDRRIGWTVYDGFVRGRGEEWTFWRAIVATVALVLNRQHGEREVRRYRARTGRLYIPHADLGFWDSRRDGYGYSYGYLHLYAGCRVEVGSDGEMTS